MMAKESGATSFIAMVQLPDDKLKEALGSPLLKVRRKYDTGHLCGRNSRIGRYLFVGQGLVFCTWQIQQREPEWLLPGPLVGV